MAVGDEGRGRPEVDADRADSAGFHGYYPYYYPLLGVLPLLKT